MEYQTVDQPTESAKQDNARVLVVDDDEDTLRLLSELLTKEGYQVRTVADAKAALADVAKMEPDVVITDIQMPGMDGMALLMELRSRVPRALVILATAYGSLEAAMEGIKAGAFDFIGKPFLLDDIRLVVRGALEHKRVLNENHAQWEQLKDRYRFENLVGTSPGMVSVYKMIARVAETDSTILLEGESGTGKELVARAIHGNSHRRAGPFVPVDGGALAESLLESELFGHERGAFTGAVAAKKGLLEKADGGTCFLDEIADISPTLQSKLLRVLQEREIRRVGRTDTQPVNVRIIAASNKDLKALVKAGKFREDLYFRLNVVTITIPPLRDRAEDIPLLAHYFAQKFAEAQGRPQMQIAPESMALLTRYAWPGNVRELEHVMERAIILAHRSAILPTDLPAELKMITPVNEEKGWRTLDQLERDYIMRVFEAHHHDLGRTAQLLDIHRKTLQRKLRRYRMSDLPPDEVGLVKDMGPPAPGGGGGVESPSSVAHGV
jgi:two-component system response regulator AtoC